MKHINLKKVIIMGSILITTASAFAQQDSVRQQKKIDEGIGIAVSIKKDSVAKSTPQKGFVMITFTRFDLGLTKLNDNGSFSLSPTNDFLDYKPWKTSHVSFDVFQLGYRFSNSFRVFLAGGFDWTLIRLDKDITFQKNQDLNNYVTEQFHITKNRFSASYLHIPLYFEFRSSKSKSGKRMRFQLAPEVAFLVDGKVKQVSTTNGKTKVSDDFHFTPFRYGATVRLGYGGLGLFAKYFANDMFDTPQQKGLKNMAFGVTLGF